MLHQKKTFFADDKRGGAKASRNMGQVDNKGFYLEQFMVAQEMILLNVCFVAEFHFFISHQQIIPVNLKNVELSPSPPKKLI